MDSLRATKIAATISTAVVLFFANGAHAQTTGNNTVHDPSRMIESEGRLYVYGTYGNKSSSDGLAWTAEPNLFPKGDPKSLQALIPKTQGIWAPDAIFLNGQYFVFYAACDSTVKNGRCAVGLVTSPTLNTKSANFKWDDRGIVVSNAPSDTYSAIDPCPFIDDDGSFWVTWGGGLPFPETADSIWITRLDLTTGLASASDPAKPGHPISKGHEEGSYLYKHNKYYYLFYNTGGCCNGTSSTYTIHVARATSVTGPYADDRVFYPSVVGTIHGPGHMGIYDQCGYSRFTYHYYPSDTAYLGENELTWGSDDWPVRGAQVTSSIKVCIPDGGVVSVPEGGSPAQDSGMGTAASSDSGGVVTTPDQDASTGHNPPPDSSGGCGCSTVGEKTYGVMSGFVSLIIGAAFALRRRQSAVVDRK